MGLENFRIFSTGVKKEERSASFSSLFVLLFSLVGESQRTILLHMLKRIEGHRSGVVTRVTLGVLYISLWSIWSVNAVPVSGPWGWGLSFDGGDYLELTRVNTGVSAWSLSFWAAFDPVSDGEDNVALFGKHLDDPIDSNLMALFRVLDPEAGPGDNPYQYQFCVGKGWETPYECRTFGRMTVTWPEATFYVVTVSCDGGTVSGDSVVQVYEDGALVVSTAIPGACFDGSVEDEADQHRYVVGMDWDEPNVRSDEFRGLMDEPSLWNKVLSGDDVVGLMKSRPTASSPGLHYAYGLEDYGENFFASIPDVSQGNGRRGDSVTSVVFPESVPSPIVQREEVEYNEEVTIALVGSDAPEDRDLTFYIYSLPSGGALIDPSDSSVITSGNNVSISGSELVYRAESAGAVDSFTYGVAAGPVGAPVAFSAPTTVRITRTGVFNPDEESGSVWTAVLIGGSIAMAVILLVVIAVLLVRAGSNGRVGSFRSGGTSQSEDPSNRSFTPITNMLAPDISTHNPAPAARRGGNKPQRTLPDLPDVSVDAEAVAAIGRGRGSQAGSVDLESDGGAAGDRHEFPTAKPATLVQSTSTDKDKKKASRFGSRRTAAKEAARAADAESSAWSAVVYTTDSTSAGPRRGSRIVSATAVELKDENAGKPQLKKKSSKANMPAPGAPLRTGHSGGAIGNESSMFDAQLGSKLVDMLFDDSSQLMKALNDTLTIEEAPNVSSQIGALVANGTGANKQALRTWIVWQELGQAGPDQGGASGSFQRSLASEITAGYLERMCRDYSSKHVSIVFGYVSKVCPKVSISEWCTPGAVTTGKSWDSFGKAIGKSLKSLTGTSNYVPLEIRLLLKDIRTKAIAKWGEDQGKRITTRVWIQLYLVRALLEPDQYNVVPTNPDGGHQAGLDLVARVLLNAGTGGAPVKFSDPGYERLNSIVTTWCPKLTSWVETLANPSDKEGSEGALSVERYLLRARGEIYAVLHSRSTALLQWLQKSPSPGSSAVASKLSGICYETGEPVFAFPSARAGYGRVTPHLPSGGLGSGVGGKKLKRQASKSSMSKKSKGSRRKQSKGSKGRRGSGGSPPKRRPSKGARSSPGKVRNGSPAKGGRASPAKRNGSPRKGRNSPPKRNGSPGKERGRSQSPQKVAFK